VKWFVKRSIENWSILGNRDHLFSSSIFCCFFIKLQEKLKKSERLTDSLFIDESTVVFIYADQDDKY